MQRVYALNFCNVIKGFQLIFDFWVAAVFDMQAF
nr:MAG TPA: hypothetical protein [Caudoviricetes sp.]